MTPSRTPRFFFLPALALLALGALALGLAACGGGSSHTEGGPDEPRQAAAPIPVPTTEAAVIEVARTFTASGSVEPWQRVSPGTKILGRIDRVPVQAGDRVQKGALLAQLEDRDLRAAVAQAEAAVAMAEAQIDNARAQHERMVALHAKGSVTDKNLEDATTGFRLAEAGVAQARANLEAARVTLTYARVESPLTGWVVERRVQGGDMAGPGQPLFTVEDLSQVKITVEVPEAEIVGLAPGDPATVVLDVLEQEVPATVDRVVPAGDPASRTFVVQLVLANPEGRIKSGMFARARFSRGVRRALRVPEKALYERGQLTGVFVVAEGEARLRWVKTGLREEGFVEILSGLTAGERYVTRPGPGLADGVPVAEVDDPEEVL